MAAEITDLAIEAIGEDRGHRDHSRLETGAGIISV